MKKGVAGGEILEWFGERLGARLPGSGPTPTDVSEREEHAQAEQMATKQHCLAAPVVCEGRSAIPVRTSTKHWLARGIRGCAESRPRHGFAASLARKIPPITEVRRSAPHLVALASQVYRPEWSGRFRSAVFDEQRIL